MSENSDPAQAKKTICMLSCLHPLKDDRIYWKEAVSLARNGYHVAHIGVSDKEYDIITEHGIRLISLKRIRYFQNPFADKIFRTITFKPNIYNAILKVAATIQADVYHFHDYQINRIGRKLKELTQKPKVIYDVHEPYPEIIRYLNKSTGFVKLFRIIYSKYLENWQNKCALYYEAILTTEENVASSFSKIIGSDKVKVINNYCDLESPHLNAETNKEYDLIYIGGISSWRGIFEMLEVSRLAKLQGYNIKILFLGHFKELYLKQKVLKFIDNHKIQEYFEYLENVPHHGVSNYLFKSKIGLCIFRDNPVYRIIMPIKIFEYMAFGIPVICNNFGHAGKIIQEENCGIVLSNPNPSAILRSIVEILNDKNEFSELSANAKRAFQTKFRWTIIEKELLNFYDKLFDTKNA